MAKKRTSISLEEETYQYLQQDSINASQLVNKLIKQHMNCGADQQQVLEFRIQQVESQLEDFQSRAERKQNELEELRKRREEHREQKQNEQEQLLADAEEALEGVPKQPDNPAVENWADKLNMQPATLLEELEGEQ